MMVNVMQVKVIEPYRVWLTFDNGEEKEVDLAPLMRGPIFERIRTDPAYFSTVYVDDEGGTIAWDNGADLDPDVLYGTYLPAWQETSMVNE